MGKNLEGKEIGHGIVQKKDGRYEARYVDIIEHSLLEQMAKTLIMAKYDLPFDYFIESQE